MQMTRRGFNELRAQQALMDHMPKVRGHIVCPCCGDAFERDFPIAVPMQILHRLWRTCGACNYEIPVSYLYQTVKCDVGYVWGRNYYTTDYGYASSSEGPSLFSEAVEYVVQGLSNQAASVQKALIVFYLQIVLFQARVKSYIKNKVK